MNKLIKKITLCAAAMLAASFAHSENYEVVSNLTNALFTSADTVTMKPIDQILAQQPSAALLDGACEKCPWGDNWIYVRTNLCNGTWKGTTNPTITIIDIAVSDDFVQIKTLEGFLIYTNSVLFARTNNSSSRCVYCISSYANIFVEQECEPPSPWTTRGIYGPYCKSQMTNRTEQINAHSKVSRKIIGYYDADGDDYATLTRLGIVHSPDGDYLDEMADGPYWMMNDVAIVEYTIPRQSYLNYVYGQEDGVNHYWQAIKAFYKVTLPTTPLKPWWKMPEYQ